MAKLYDEQFANVADYDCFSQSLFESVDGLVRMKDDPFYEEFIRMDHENFADTKNTKYVSAALSLHYWNRVLLATSLSRESACTKRDRCRNLFCSYIHLTLTYHP